MTGAIKFNEQDGSEALEDNERLVFLPNGDPRPPQFEFQTSCGDFTVEVVMLRDDEGNISIGGIECIVLNRAIAPGNVSCSLRVTDAGGIDGDCRIVHESDDFPRFILNLGVI